MTTKAQRVIDQETKGHRWTPKGLPGRPELIGYAIGYGLVVLAIVGLVAIVGAVLGSLALYVVQLITG